MNTCDTCGCGQPSYGPNADGNPYGQYTPEHRVWAKAQEHGRAAAALEGYQDAPGLDGDYTESDLLRDAGWVPHDGTALRDDLIAQYRNDAAAAFHEEAGRRLDLAGSLNDRMEFDHPVRVAADGTVHDHLPGVYAPELHMGVDDDGQILAGHEADYVAQAERQGWHPLAGWTGQYAYHGIVMHPSEFVGGRLAEHIIANPGTYVVTSVETDDDSDDAAGWAIFYRPEPEQHADYPHEPGRLYDCPACDGSCHCTAGYAPCVYEGPHNGLAEATDEEVAAETFCATCGHLDEPGKHLYAECPRYVPGHAEIKREGR